MTILRCALWSALIGAAGLVQASPSPAGSPMLVLCVDRAIHSRTDPYSFRIILTNRGTATAGPCGTMQWSVWQSGRLVFGPVALAPIRLDRGQSTSWMWQKVGNARRPLPVGSYTIRLDGVPQGWGGPALSYRVAITPTGTLAGRAYFPLAVGNEWTFSSGTSRESVSVGEGFLLRNLAGETLWAAMSATTLFASTGGGSLQQLFAFGCGAGSSWPVDFGTNFRRARIHVGTTRDVVGTPVGSFADCIRFDVLPDDGIPRPYSALWFAPGIGLVQFRKGLSFFKLSRVRIHADGMTFVVGE